MARQVRRVPSPGRNADGKSVVRVPTSWSNPVTIAIAPGSEFHRFCGAGGRGPPSLSGGRLAARATARTSRLRAGIALRFLFFHRAARGRRASRRPPTSPPRFAEMEEKPARDGPRTWSRTDPGMHTTDNHRLRSRALRAGSSASSTTAPEVTLETWWTRSWQNGNAPTAGANPRHRTRRAVRGRCWARRSVARNCVDPQRRVAERRQLPIPCSRQSRVGPIRMSGEPFSVAARAENTEARKICALGRPNLSPGARISLEKGRYFLSVAGLLLCSSESGAAFGQGRSRDSSAAAAHDRRLGSPGSRGGNRPLSFLVERLERADHFRASSAPNTTEATQTDWDDRWRRWRGLEPSGSIARTSLPPHQASARPSAVLLVASSRPCRTGHPLARNVRSLPWTAECSPPDGRRSRRRGPAGGGRRHHPSPDHGARLPVLRGTRARFPRDKCCGDGLTAGALRLLEELGLDPTTIDSWQPVVRRGRAPRRRAMKVVFPLPRGTRPVSPAVARTSRSRTSALNRSRAQRRSEGARRAMHCSRRANEDRSHRARRERQSAPCRRGMPSSARWHCGLRCARP